MLTKEVIDLLYKKYDSRPESPDELDIALLFEHLFEMHDPQIDAEGNLVVASISPESPFHSIPLRNVHAIVNFEDEVAIVLHSSIVILLKNEPKVYINLRTPRRSVSERLSSLFSRSSRGNHRDGER